MIKLFNLNAKTKNEIKKMTKNYSRVEVHDQERKGIIQKENGVYEIYIANIKARKNNELFRTMLYFPNADFYDTLIFSENYDYFEDNSVKLFEPKNFKTKLYIKYYFKKIDEIELFLKSDLLSIRLFIKKDEMRESSENKIFIVKENNKYFMIDFLQLTDFVNLISKKFNQNKFDTIEYLFKNLNCEHVSLYESWKNLTIDVKNFDEFKEVNDFFKKYL